MQRRKAILDISILTMLKSFNPGLKRKWWSYQPFTIQVQNILTILFFEIYIFKKGTEGLKKGNICHYCIPHSCTLITLLGYLWIRFNKLSYLTLKKLLIKYSISSSYQSNIFQHVEKVMYVKYWQPTNLHLTKNKLFSLSFESVSTNFHFLISTSTYSAVL